jgi:HAD superfamily hydrolase (TIGR01549 family)
VPVTVIVFDVEGTLIDCVPQTIECWRQTLARRGFVFQPEELHRYSGMDAKLMLAKLLPEADNDLKQELLDEQGKSYSKQFMPTAKPFAGARELFSALAQAGHRLGLATTSQPDELRFYLRLLDVTDHVTATVCGNDVSHEKPAPDMIKLAAQRLAMDQPADLWTVGDTPYDAEATLAAGGKPLGTLGGGFSAEKLRSAGCIAVARDLIDLRNRMNRRLAKSDL